MHSQQSTQTQIIALLSQLSEGDRVRVLRFVEAIIQQKAGKRAQRQRRFLER